LQNPDWFDNLVPAYPDCPRILAAKRELMLLAKLYKSSKEKYITVQKVPK